MDIIHSQEQLIQFRDNLITVMTAKTAAVQEAANIVNCWNDSRRHGKPGPTPETIKSVLGSEYMLELSAVHAKTWNRLPSCFPDSLKTAIERARAENRNLPPSMNLDSPSSFNTEIAYGIARNGIDFSEITTPEELREFVEGCRWTLAGWNSKENQSYFLLGKELASLVREEVSAVFGYFSNAPLPPCATPDGLLIGEVTRITGMVSKTINRHCGLKGIRKTRRGERNRNFNRGELIKIAESLREAGSSDQADAILAELNNGHQMDIK